MLEKIMPINKCSNNGKSGYKWGDSGTCYTGKTGKKKAMKQGVAIELSKQRAGKPSEFDKAALPTDAMIANAQKGLELRKQYGKGGENLIVLTLAQHIADGEFIPFESVNRMRSEYNKRSRFASASENTMGYINFMLLGGVDTRNWLDEM